MYCLYPRLLCILSHSKQCSLPAGGSCRVTHGESVYSRMIAMQRGSRSTYGKFWKTGNFMRECAKFLRLCLGLFRNFSETWHILSVRSGPSLCAGPSHLCFAGLQVQRGTRYAWSTSCLLLLWCLLRLGAPLQIAFTANWPFRLFTAFLPGVMSA